MRGTPVLAVPEIERVFREEYGRAVAVLVRIFGDIDVAEEAVQDAFTVASERWPSTGLPPSPAGWIITTARNRAIDRLRREASREGRHAEAALLQAGDGAAEPGQPSEHGEDALRDDRLRLIFTCCHPALGNGVQVALTLRLLGGLSPPARSRTPSWYRSRPWRSGWYGPKPRSVRQRSRTGCRTRPICPTACEPCWPSCT
jgi:RNA polymerase sigma-70 factor (ECF subfamily)